MWGASRTARSALVAVFTVAFMTAGVTAALSAEQDVPYSITAESNECETVTISMQGVWGWDLDTHTVWQPNPFVWQGTVNGVEQNGNSVGSSQIVFTSVVPGLANWLGTFWFDYWAFDGSWKLSQGKFWNQGTVQVAPCPVTTTTTTTQPTDTSTTTTVAQVETDLPDSAGPGFGLIAVAAAIGVSLLGGAALIAARREN